MASFVNLLWRSLSLILDSLRVRATLSEATLDRRFLYRTSTGQVRIIADLRLSVKDA